MFGRHKQDDYESYNERANEKYDDSLRELHNFRLDKYILRCDRSARYRDSRNYGHIGRAETDNGH